MKRDLTETAEHRIRTELERAARPVRAPDDLWPRVRAKLREPAQGQRRPTWRRRWVAVPVLAVAGAIGLLVLTLVLPRIGGDREVDVGNILARAAAAAADPASVGLESYVGRIENINPAVSAPAPDDTISVWYQAPNRFRIEFSDAEVFVSDGEELWSYEPESHTYSRGPLPDMSSTPVGFTRLLYMLLFPGRFNIEDVLAAIREELPEGDVSLSEDETLLGREAYLLEGTYEANECWDGPCDATITVRFWLDKLYLLPLRLEEHTNSGADAFGFTAIEFDVPINEEVFQFTPPPGAIPREVHSLQSSLPAGALVPMWLPEGYASAGGETSTRTAAGDLVQVHFRLQDDGTGMVEVDQEAGNDGVPDDLKRGGQIEIRGHDAWLEHRADGFTVLVWEEGDLTVTIKANQLSDGDLLRIAASMERVPEDDTAKISPVPAG